MLPVVGGRRGRRGLIRDKVEKAVLEQEQRAVVATAESLRGFDYLVQNRLEPGRASDRPQDPADRPLLLTRVLELTRDVRIRGCGAAHWKSLVRSHGCAERARRQGDPRDPQPAEGGNEATPETRDLMIEVAPIGSRILKSHR